jgi:hypothetical protein
MTLDLAGRRALLRDALAGDDPADFSGFAAAVAQAGAEDRAALARTLPPSRLFKAEGPTPRAAFAVAALGRPARKLVELAARLAADYGVPVAVPPALSAKRKGGSALAVAVRALEALRPNPTALVAEAAAQARAALEGGPR